HLTDGIHQCCHLLQPLDHGVDACRCQLQTVEQRCVETARASVLHVLLIGFQYGSTTLVDAVCHRQQRGVLLRCAGSRNSTTGSPGFTAQGIHIGVDVERCSTVHFGTRAPKREHYSAPAPSSVSLATSGCYSCGTAWSRSPPGGICRLSWYSDTIPSTIIRNAGE